VPDLNVLVAFYSRSGSTEKLAQGVAEGAKEAGAEVRLRRARDFVAEDIIRTVPGWAEHRDRMHKEYEAPTADDAVWADGIVFGTPTRFGNICAELKAYVDSLGGPWLKGLLNGKVGAAFSSTMTQHGGNESTIITMYNFMAHLGLILVPTGYADPVMFGGGTPYGATTSTGQQGALPNEAAMAVARFQGKRVAEIASKLKK
jgi:NAD(P)H dehydrogenase (quinone)